ncbi:MAG: nucleic acid-binding protein [Deltaproteobacteria bacterium]|nr:MAG: nucleic acid-binding protein [Deltaproteobacteria bacterium]
MRNRVAFAYSSKRRRDFPSQTHVQRGQRTVNGNKDLTEKLGRNDPYPCGSRRRFQKVLHGDG